MAQSFRVRGAATGAVMALLLVAATTLAVCSSGADAARIRRDRREITDKDHALGVVSQVTAPLTSAEGIRAASWAAAYSSVAGSSGTASLMVLSALDVTAAVSVAVNTSAHAPSALFPSVLGRSATGYEAISAGPTSVSVSSTTLGMTNVTFWAVADHRYTVAVAAEPGQFLVVQVLDDTVSWPYPEDHIDLCKVRLLNMDPYHTTVSMYSTSANCFRCEKLFRNVSEFGSGVAPLMTMLVPHDVVMEFRSNGVSMGNLTYSFRELGVYSVVVPPTPAGKAWSSAYIVTHDEGHNTAIPLIVAAIVMAAIALLVTLLDKYACSRWWNWGRRRSSASEDSDVDIKPKKSGRVVAIDTFRGVALTIMIFVNYGGGGYWFLDHSWWNGLTVADLVFPWFVWIMGVSMAISHRSARRSGSTRWDISKKIVVRSIKLYALGCFLNDGSDLSNWRFLGVLQYFAVSSLVVGLIATWLPGGKEEEKRYGDLILEPENNHLLTGLKPQPTKWFSDFAPYWMQHLIILTLLGIYLLVQYLLPVPGCATGYTGPGGFGNYGADYACTGGAHGRIDRLIFGEHHMYHNLDSNYNPISAATCGGKERYNCEVYDPEGTLGFITATLMCYLGLQCGRIVVHHKGNFARLARWVIWGLALCGIGTLLCGASQNDGVMPLTKNLWSPSFVITQAGTGFLVLSVFFVLVDWWQVWEGRPFKFMGMNSIVVYAGSEILQTYFPFTVMIHPANNVSGFVDHTEYLISNIIGVCSWFIVSYSFYANDWFYNL